MSRLGVRLRFMFTAGGTGGHLTPAIAVAEQIRKHEPDASVMFLTAGRPVDEVFLEPTGYDRVPLFQGSRAPKKTHLTKWFSAWRRARSAIANFRPDVVVGLGGYPTLIGGGAAVMSRNAPPLVLLEQNAHAGKAVKYLASCSRCVLLSMAAAESGLPAGVTREVIGNPLPATYVDPAARLTPLDPRQFGLEAGRLTLLVLGGSQGARGVNRIVLGARDPLAQEFPNLQVLIVAGETDVASVRQEVSKQPHPPTVVTAFSDRMRDLYELADVVVARAGGTTLAELAIIGRPMVLVPYPHHKDQHQLANAEVFAQVGAAKIVPEGPSAHAGFLEAVSPWLSDEEERQRAGEAARGLGRPLAAADAAERVLRIAKEHEGARR